MLDYKLKLEELNSIEKKRRLSDEEYFMQQRIFKYLQALEYKMEYTMYQGGVCPDTLDFCKNRNNRVFSIDEIMEWKDSPDRPEIENYDPILHLGGNKCFKNQTFCNHDLTYIGKVAAQKYRPDLIKDMPKKQEIKLSETLNEKTRIAVEKTRKELYQYASPNQKFMVDHLLNFFANEVLEKNEKLIKDNKEISVEEALEDTAKSILKVLNLTKFGL